MEEDKIVVTEIQPLRWPGGIKPKLSGFFEVTLNPYKHLHKELAILDKEVDARPPIPPEVWGADPQRQRMGARISELVGYCFDWPISRFVPEDPLEILCSSREICMADSAMELEDKIGKEILDGFSWMDTLGDSKLLTLGDLVDYCLKNVNDESSKEWRPDPTENVCPTFSAFHDLRRFFCSRYLLEKKAIRPSTLLSIYRIRECNWRFLNCYLARRFKCQSVVCRYFLGLVPCKWTWLVLFMSLSVYDVVYCNAPFFYGGTLGTAIITGIVVYFLSWPKWRKGLRTFRDLVEYLVEESKSGTPV